MTLARIEEKSNETQKLAMVISNIKFVTQQAIQGAVEEYLKGQIWKSPFSDLIINTTLWFQ